MQIRDNGNDLPPGGTVDVMVSTMPLTSVTGEI